MFSHAVSAKLQSKLRNLLLVTGITAVSAAGFIGCNDDDKMMAPQPPQSIGRSVFAIDANNNLIRFGAQSPSVVTRRAAVSGLQSGETVVGLDFRPVDKKLYALGSTSRVYTLDTLTAAATLVGATAFTPALNGASFGFDFNPVPDRIRVHSDADQDLRLNPITGAIAGVDSVLAYNAGDANFGVNPNITGTAYTNSVAGAATTVLFAIDFNRDILVTLPSPNNGKMVTIGALGVNISGFVGFDIAGDTGMAYASLTAGASGSSFYTINLTTGAATLVGNIDNSAPLRGISVAP
jgi:hypothetical protein